MSQPLECQLPIQHVRQKYNWDCGLACVAMVLPDSDRAHFSNNFNTICKSEGFNKSTWTIDLCYLLRRYNIENTFCTLTLGVYKGYKYNSFYEKVFSKDEERINRRFNMASQHGIKLQQTSVSLETILQHLQIGPVIVLTNARLITCEECKHNKISTEFRKCLPSFMPYQGHYVVLTGYNLQRQMIYYRNPAFTEHVCMMRFGCFEESHKSYGTDHDVIFVNYNKEQL